MRELVKKLRKYQIKIRKAINNQMQGDFHSVFKGSGLEFDDVRSYQYGDDVRIIDWHVSAKGHGTFVKTFKEEKEQIVFFLLDVSASQEIGNPGRRKIDIAKEICGVLALSAVHEQSQIGLVCYSNQKEKYIKPGLTRILLNGLSVNCNRLAVFLLRTVKTAPLIVIFLFRCGHESGRE